MVRITFTPPVPGTNSLIPAIRAVRTHLAWSLKEAKDAVEAGAFDVKDPVAVNVNALVRDLSGVVSNLHYTSPKGCLPTVSESLTQLTFIKDTIFRKLMVHVVAVARAIESRIP